MFSGHAYKNVILTHSKSINILKDWLLQAECDELAAKVQSLTSENASLREELNRMTEECKKLSADNASLLVRGESLNCCACY